MQASARGTGLSTAPVPDKCGKTSLSRVITASFCLVVILGLLSIGGATADTATPILTIHAVRYRFAPAEITLKKGQPVRLVFIADDVAHGISIPGLGVDVPLPKHKAQSVIVIPGTPGDFDGKCSKYCGTGHSDMTLLVHVTP
jgi:cytochrome c oxidase subunit II